MVASVSQVIIGYFGIIGLMLKYITPLTVAPSVSMIGMSLFKSASGLAAMNWPISMRLVIKHALLDPKQNMLTFILFFSTVVLMVLFSQYLKDVPFFYPMYKKHRFVFQTYFDDIYQS